MYTNYRDRESERITKMRTNKKTKLSYLAEKLKALSSEELGKMLPSGFQYFSDGTSFHGFHELYHAKSLVWKLFWFIICFGSFGLTGYQVYNASCTYISDSTATLIFPAVETDIMYPPLDLCFWHWYYWVDWKKATALVKNKQTLLYAVSFFNTIYTNEFDVEKARSDFVDILRVNNMTTLSDFYYAVARDVPITADNGIKKYFDRVKLLNNVDYHMFCYEVSGDNMKTFFKQNINDDGTVRPKIITFNTYDETYVNFTKFVTQDEHNWYVRRWVDKHSMYTIDNDDTSCNSSSSAPFFAKFTPPKLLLLTGRNVDRSVEIQVENDVYQFDVQASVYTWENRIGKVCDDSQPALSSATTCQSICLALYDNSTCSCQDLPESSSIKTDTLSAVCQKGFIYYSTSNNESLTTTNNSAHTTQTCTQEPKIQTEYYKCLNACVPACQIWSYDKTLTIRSTSKILRAVGTKSFTTVRLNYPMGKDIVIMTETDAQSWENFIGNVGGLLGIWTGASMVSFIEMIYLCCCADHDECTSCPTCPTGGVRPIKKSKIKVKVITVKTITD